MIQIHGQSMIQIHGQSTIQIHGQSMIHVHPTTCPNSTRGHAVDLSCSDEHQNLAAFHTTLVVAQRNVKARSVKGSEFKFKVVVLRVEHV